MYDVTSVLLNTEEILPPTSSEYRLIMSVYKELTQPMPTTATGLETKLSALDVSRPMLCSLYSLLSIERSKCSRSYHSSYDREATKLVKLGRPSAGAIEQEIHSKDAELFSMRFKLEMYETLQSLVNSLIRCLDQTRSTCIESWRDARRTD